MNWSGFATIVVAWLKARALERSTWVGIVGALATLLSLKLSADQQAQISDLIAMVMSGLLVVTKTKHD